MVFTLSRSKKSRTILYISKKGICTNVNSHVNISKSNNLNKSNSDNGTENLNLLRINVQNYSPFDKIINLKKSNRYRVKC